MFEMELLSLGSSDNLPWIHLRPNCLIIILCSIFNEIAYNEQAPPYYVKKGSFTCISEGEEGQVLLNPLEMIATFLSSATIRHPHSNTDIPLGRALHFSQAKLKSCAIIAQTICEEVCNSTSKGTQLWVKMCCGFYNGNTVQQMPLLHFQQLVRGHKGILTTNREL